MSQTGEKALVNGGRAGPKEKEKGRYLSIPVPLHPFISYLRTFHLRVYGELRDSRKPSMRRGSRSVSWRPEGARQRISQPGNF